MADALSIGVIARLKSNTVEIELAREARARGHAYDRISFNNVELTNSVAMFEEANLLAYDVLYYRTSIGDVWAYALEKYLRTYNRKAINLTIAQHPYRYRKTYQALAVAPLGVPVPKTVLNSTDSYENIASEIGLTFVVKADISARGDDVHLVHNADRLAEFTPQREAKKYFYQEYIPHDHDYRVHLIGGKAIAAYKRVPCFGDFRANVSRGATMHEVSDATKQALYPLAERVGAHLGLSICAVDFIQRSTDGAYYFAEVNLNPGWETSDKDATGKDMSALVVDYFESVAHAQ